MNSLSFSFEWILNLLVHIHSDTYTKSRYSIEQQVATNTDDMAHNFHIKRNGLKNKWSWSSSSRPYLDSRFIYIFFIFIQNACFVVFFFLLLFLAASLFNL